MTALEPARLEQPIEAGSGELGKKKLWEEAYSEIQYYPCKFRN